MLLYLVGLHIKAKISLLIGLFMPSLLSKNKKKYFCRVYCYWLFKRHETMERISSRGCIDKVQSVF